MATRDIYQEITDKVLAQLEEGTVPWRIPFNTQEGMHRNYQSGRVYRGINQMLLAMSGYEQPYWMTFKAMREAGGELRGEKGTQRATMVTLWKRITVKCRDEQCSVCHGTGRKHKQMMFLRHYNVFNIEQTTLVPPDLPEPDPDMVPESGADAVWNGYLFRETKLNVTALPGGAYYMPRDDTVNVPSMRHFTEVAAYYSTAFHEFAHSTGHADRLGRKGIMERIVFGSEDYSDEELVAEFTASMLLGVCGLFHGERMAMSAAYIDHWRQNITADPKLLVHAAARAQRAADYILGVTPYVDEPEKVEAS